MNVNLHHLQLFYFVAKARGVSAAVKIIPYGIQQPAVSQQLIQLEEALGVKLFERRPFSLTPAGESLYRFVSKFFDNLEGELESLKDEAGIRIRFGCPTVISAKYLPKLIGSIIKKHPEIRPNIHEYNGNANFAALINREIDIAISFTDMSRSKAVESKVIAEWPMALVVPANHRFIEQGFWPKSDFAKEKWIAIQESTGGTQELREGLSQFGIAPEIIASTDSVEAALSYVEMGLGVTLMVQPPPSMLEKLNIASIPLPDIFGKIKLSIAWHRECLLDEKILNFVCKTASGIANRIYD
jgi:DNA-binding transcriptional LysR family regulator